MVPFSLGLLSADSIQAVPSLVNAHGGRLHALVLNSGIAEGSWVDLTPLAVYRRVAEVNFLGHLHQTKLLVPALLPRRTLPRLSVAAGVWW